MVSIVIAGLLYIFFIEPYLENKKSKSESNETLQRHYADLQAGDLLARIDRKQRTESPESIILVVAVYPKKLEIKTRRSLTDDRGQRRHFAQAFNYGYWIIIPKASKHYEEHLLLFAKQ